MTVFAKDADTGEIGCYILHLDSPGVTREAIKGKIPCRPLQNMQLFFQNVKIPAKNKLPGVKGFESVSTLLAESRIAVGWVAVGVGMGAYDFMMKYLKTRTQFDKSLLAYQLIQDKIFKVMSKVQQAALLCWQA
jgi:glutaryl-CoA dehydrogenase